MDNKMQEYIVFAKEIAYKAGEIMLKYFNGNNGEYYKEDKTIVTKADNEINTYLIEQVKEKFPNHAVDGEEEKFGNSDYVWVCDPVDGTCPYAKNIPVSVFSLALVVEGKSLVGVVYDPFMKNMYSAIKGQGAFLNDKKISVNNILLDDKRSISNFDNWPNSPYNIYPLITELGKKTYFLSIGSVIRACMCVATGEFNLALFPGTKNKNCDIAAVKVIVEEAGGKVTNLFGEEQKYNTDINGAIVSNNLVHDEVVDAVKKIIQGGK